MAWSYSALTAYETCPRRYAETRIYKHVPDPPGAEAQWGTRVHKALEDRVKTNQPITGALSMYEPFAAKICTFPGVIRAEQKIALNRDLKAVGYFAKDVWVRAVLDVMVVNLPRVFIADYKTGKRKPESQQLELSAAVAAALHPEAEEFDTMFLWLKDKAVDKEHFKRGDIDGIWSRFLPRVERLETAVKDGDFPPKPSGLCKRYCPVSSCEYCGE
jgi:hypothetical protein